MTSTKLTLYTEGNCDAPPYGLRWRYSFWFVTFVVGLGIATDLLVYSVIVVAIPFQLEKLGYSAISVRTIWLAATIPVAMFSERYGARKAPLVIGILILIGAQVMLMEAPFYWLMCLARILQGVGSTMVWVVGLALLCDMTPTKLIGRQLGLAMTGVSIGLLVGPPVGGALYSRFGFRGPIIFGIISAVLDLVGRLLVVEPKEARRWEQQSLHIPDLPELPMHGSLQSPNSPISAISPIFTKKDSMMKAGDGNKHQEKASGSTESPGSRPRSLFSVLALFVKSPRAITVTFLTFVFGILYTCVEPTLPLHMQSVWGWDSSKVGLLFLAAVVPSLFSGPVTGIIADKYGTAWITLLSFICSLPWWGLMVIDNLPLFIASFALSSFFLSGAIQSSLVAELAAVSRNIDGVGYAHVYAAFNFAYGIGSSVGPIVGGQIYYEIDQGWMALCLLAVGLLSFSFLLSFFYIGDVPVFGQFRRLCAR
ncbi:MFS general substrate transporter [Lentinula aciculospora]|uniref:MFS general substrate transporter n=1 Tax=Lentinula aciculospora TaxID=153920 RepID=A0A9W9DTS8_9AGAR|nr:MFS general substrate transporter [Lentinula aciculospora]